MSKIIIIYVYIAVVSNGNNYSKERNYAGIYDKTKEEEITRK
jgi:hypothetical protein